jgi:hypothetical protein
MLPGKQAVDVDVVLIEYASRYIVELQNLSLKYPEWNVEQRRVFLAQRGIGEGKLFELRSFERGVGKAFSALIIVHGLAGELDRMVSASHMTNAGMREFDLVPVDPALTAPEAR